MHHAGLQYGQQGSNHLQNSGQQPPPSTQQQYQSPSIPSNQNPNQQQSQTASNQNASNSATTSETSLLRQWRKRDDKSQFISQSEVPQQVDTINGNEGGPIARVAPHAHYPHRNDSLYTRYHYQQSYNGYKDLSQVKYSEIVEPQHMMHPKLSSKEHHHHSMGTTYFEQQQQRYNMAHQYQQHINYFKMPPNNYQRSYPVVPGVPGVPSVNDPYNLEQQQYQQQQQYNRLYRTQANYPTAASSGTPSSSLNKNYNAFLYGKQQHHYNYELYKLNPSQCYPSGVSTGRQYNVLGHNHHQIMEYQQSPPYVQTRADYPLLPPSSQVNVNQGILNDLVGGGGVGEGVVRNSSGSLKQFLESWNDEPGEANSLNSGGGGSAAANVVADNKEQSLYILDSTEIPTDSIEPFIHLQVTQLPENIKGFLNPSAVSTGNASGGANGNASVIRPVDLTTGTSVQSDQGVAGVALAEPVHQVQEGVIRENRIVVGNQEVAKKIDNNVASSVIVFGEQEKSSNFDENKNLVAASDQSVIILNGSHEEKNDYSSKDKEVTTCEENTFEEILQEKITEEAENLIYQKEESISETTDLLQSAKDQNLLQSSENQNLLQSSENQNSLQTLGIDEAKLAVEAKEKQPEPLKSNFEASEVCKPQQNLESPNKTTPETVKNTSEVLEKVPQSSEVEETTNENLAKSSESDKITENENNSVEISETTNLNETSTTDKSFDLTNEEKSTEEKTQPNLTLEESEFLHPELLKAENGIVVRDDSVILQIANQVLRIKVVAKDNPGKSEESVVNIEAITDCSLKLQQYSSRETKSVATSPNYEFNDSFKEETITETAADVVTVSVPEAMTQIEMELEAEECQDVVVSTLDAVPENLASSKNDSELQQNFDEILEKNSSLGNCNLEPQEACPVEPEAKPDVKPDEKPLKILKPVILEAKKKSPTLRCRISLKKTMLNKTNLKDQKVRSVACAKRSLEYKKWKKKLLYAKSSKNSQFLNNGQKLAEAETSSEENQKTDSKDQTPKEETPRKLTTATTLSAAKPEELTYSKSKHNFSIIQGKREKVKIKTPSSRNKKLESLVESSIEVQQKPSKCSTPPHRPEEDHHSEVIIGFVKTKAELKQSVPVPKISAAKTKDASGRKRLSLEEYKKKRQDSTEKIIVDGNSEKNSEFRIQNCKEQDFETLLEKVLDTPSNKLHIPAIIENIPLPEDVPIIRSSPILIELDKNTQRPTDPRIQKYQLQQQQPKSKIAEVTREASPNTPPRLELTPSPILTSTPSPPQIVQSIPAERPQTPQRVRSPKSPEANIQEDLSKKIDDIFNGTLLFNRRPSVKAAEIPLQKKKFLINLDEIATNLRRLPVIDPDDFNLDCNDVAGDFGPRPKMKNIIDLNELLIPKVRESQKFCSDFEDDHQLNHQLKHPMICQTKNEIVIGRFSSKFNEENIEEFINKEPPNLTNVPTESNLENRRIEANENPISTLETDNRKETTIPSIETETETKESPKSAIEKQTNQSNNFQISPEDVVSCTIEETKLTIRNLRKLELQAADSSAKEQQPVQEEYTSSVSEDFKLKLQLRKVRKKMPRKRKRTPSTVNDLEDYSVVEDNTSPNSNGIPKLIIKRVCDHNSNNSNSLLQQQQQQQLPQQQRQQPQQQQQQISSSVTSSPLATSNNSTNDRMMELMQPVVVRIERDPNLDLMAKSEIKSPS